MVRKYKPFFFLLPSLVFLILFTYFPIGYSLFYSFHEYNIYTRKPIFCGLKNYINMLHDSIFWQVVFNNVIYGVFTIFPTMLLALFLAILIDEVSKFKTFYQIGIFYPTIIPMTAAAMVWMFMYDPSLGIINKFLGLLHLPQPGWLGDSKTSLLSLIIMAIWKNLGYYMLLYLAGLQLIPRELYEAADIEGANWFRKHYHVTFPLVSPTTLFVFIVSIIQSFKVFTQVYLMTQGGPGYSSSVLVFYIYENAFRYWDIGMASALTSVMILVLLFLVLLVFGVFGKRVTYSLI